MQFPGPSSEDRAQLRADAAELGRLGNTFEAEGFGRNANTWHGWKRLLDKEGFDLGPMARRERGGDADCRARGFPAVRCDEHRSGGFPIPARVISAKRVDQFAEGGSVEFRRS
jgi:hypothetical protein